MPRLGSSGIRFTRPRSAAAPNSGLVANAKEAQKMTPWKNYLAETKPPTGFFARQAVTPCRGQSEPSFCVTRRARANGPAKACHARSPEKPQMIQHSLAPSDSFPRFAGPGHWNDPDMLEIGNGGMRPNEEKTHMSLWCLLSAPLIAGNDLTEMTPQTLAILTNPDVIAVDQDPAGNEGYRIWQEGPLQIWMKVMADRSRVVALFNLGIRPNRLLSISARSASARPSRCATCGNARTLERSTAATRRGCRGTAWCW